MTISFETLRLKVFEITGDLAVSERNALLKRIPDVLAPPVVENLPTHFHGITTVELASAWLDQMLSESRLLLVKSKNDDLIGFLFIHVANETDAHLGYLLAEERWGKGLASELLNGFITEVVKAESWLKLVGGVEQSNIASAKLLKKLGFVEQPPNENGMVFYEYSISPEI